MRVLIPVIGAALLVLQPTLARAWYTPWSQGGFGSAYPWGGGNYNTFSPWGNTAGWGGNSWPSTSWFNSGSGFQPWGSPFQPWGNSGGFNTFQPWGGGWGGVNPWNAWRGNYGSYPYGWNPTGLYNYPHWQSFSNPMGYQRGVNPSVGSGYNPWVNNMATPSGAYPVAPTRAASPLVPLYNSNTASSYPASAANDPLPTHRTTSGQTQGLVYPDEVNRGEESASTLPESAVETGKVFAPF